MSLKYEPSSEHGKGGRPATTDDESVNAEKPTKKSRGVTKRARHTLTLVVFSYWRACSTFTWSRLRNKKDEDEEDEEGGQTSDDGRRVSECREAQARGPSERQHLALTVLHVPHSLASE